MSDTSQGPDWWQASDGKWYPPEAAPPAAGTPSRTIPAFKKVVITKVQYLGGHPAHPKKETLNLLLDSDGIKAKRFATIFSFPWSDVTELAVDGPDQVEKRVTVTRLLATGIFAFALKKKQKQGYLVVTTAQGEAIFECNSTPLELRAQLSAVLSAYNS